MTSNIGFQPAASAQRSSDEIENESFFPSLNIATFTENYGIPTKLTDDQIKQTVLLSAAQVNLALQTYKANKLANGIASLGEVTTETIGGQNLKEMFYRQAVYNKAKASLLREMISVDRKPAAESEAETAEQLVAYYESASSRAISNVLDQRGIGVYLI